MRRKLNREKFHFIQETKHFSYKEEFRHQLKSYNLQQNKIFAILRNAVNVVALIRKELQKYDGNEYFCITFQNLFNIGIDKQLFQILFGSCSWPFQL